MKKARAIFSDKTLGLEEKTKQIILFIKQELSPEERKLVRPPLPPVLDQLPEEVDNDSS